MGKKQFDYIENRIKEAAENSEPSFDESAWTKMEKRLDEENNKKRRFLLWWFLLPLLFIGAGGGSLFLLKNRFTENITVSQRDKNYVTRDSSLKQNNISGETITPVNTEVDAAKKIVQDKKTSTEISKGISPSRDNGMDAEKGIGNRSIKKVQRTQKGKLSSIAKNPEIGANDELSSGVINNIDFIEQAPDSKDSKNDREGDITDTLKKIDSAKRVVVKNAPDSNASNKSKEITSSRFYFLASVGAEVTGVKLFSFKDNPISAKYGVGVGYQLNEKVSIQTGFYAGMKKYIAGPEDYNPTRKIPDTVHIVWVDASCLVYDIPITIRYNFVQKPTTIFYATAGLSSFIMKREDYYYYYMGNFGPHEYAKPYTGNSNFFSVFNISAGIEKKLSSNFSILAEPAISIPISGVGWGRVKLYSTALQVGIKYNPHRKHK